MSTFPARDEEAIRLLKEDPEAYFASTRLPQFDFRPYQPPPVGPRWWHRLRHHVITSKVVRSGDVAIGDFAAALTLMELTCECGRKWHKAKVEKR